MVNRAEITRLGQSVDQEKRLHPDAIQRTFSALQKYQKLIQKHDVHTVLVGGTSAMRDASNGSEFIRKIKKEFGWQIHILTGDDEARLVYAATREEFREIDSEFLIVDIGGGSTEFILGNSQKYQFAKSLNIGTVRFTEKFIRNDPPLDNELQAARDEISSQLIGSLDNLSFQSDATTLIGVSGTVTTLLAVEEKLKEYQPEKIHKQPLTRSQIDSLVKQFCSMPIEQRQHLPGLEPKRADVIIMGTIILQEVMQHFKFEKLLVSDRGVRYGLLYEYLTK